MSLLIAREIAPNEAGIIALLLDSFSGRKGGELAHDSPYLGKNYCLVGLTGP